MSEEEISASGQYPTLISTDFATSYQTPNSAPQQSANATPIVHTAGELASALAAQPAKQPTSAEISDAVAAANANLASSNRTLEYRVDAATGISIATIRNSQVGVVLQQIPGANIIALARMLQGWSPGKHMLLDLIA
jgi:uncharacterized FlaG/YvyC family protein